MNEQSEVWAGEFGDQYTERNKIDHRRHLPIWIDVVSELDPSYHIYSILEVGCNRGHNLKALEDFLRINYSPVVGIDVNEYALSKARRSGCTVQQGNILNLPFAANSFDLVFTMGVLIHISPDNLPQAVKEMYRVSRRFILAIEYPAEVEEVVQYHGRDDLLWKRDFSKVFLGAYPEMRVRKHWRWGGEYSSFYDRLDGWLFEKETERDQTFFDLRRMWSKYVNKKRST